MNRSLRTIEVDSATAELLEEEAQARGLTLAEFLAKIADGALHTSPAFEGMREAGVGPWAPEILAQDARNLAEFEHTGEGVPFSEIETWMKSWGTPDELPPPKPRKL